MSDEVKYAYLKSHPLFTNMPDRKIAEACKLAKLRAVYRGETFSFGEGSYSKIFLLIKGKIKITESNDHDNDLIKDILTSPDVFGDLSLENCYSIDEQAEALTSNTIICYFNILDFKRFLQDNPLMALS